MKKKKQARLRDDAARRQSDRCYYCKALMCIGPEAEFANAHGLRPRTAGMFRCTAEHLVPLSEGGPTTPGNIVAAHRYCNSMRHRSRQPRDHATYKRRVETSVLAGRWPTAALLVR